MRNGDGVIFFLKRAVVHRAATLAEFILSNEGPRSTAVFSIIFYRSGYEVPFIMIEI